MKIYTVTFIGHRYISDFNFVEQIVEELIYELISTKHYVEFLVGREGDFDQIVTSAILRVRKRINYSNSSLVWVMPYETSNYKK